jgi:hypothetical protein
LYGKLPDCQRKKDYRLVLKLTSSIEFRPTRCLHVVVSNEPTLTRAPTRIGATHGLKIVVTDKSTLTTSTPSDGATVRLRVIVSNEAALTQIPFSHGTT